MNVLLQHRALIRENIVVLIGIALCVYFSYHALQGNRSMARLFTLNHSIETLSLQLEESRAERIALEKKVVSMRPGSMSKDLLEERVRSILGYRHPDEIELNRN